MAVEYPRGSKAPDVPAKEPTTDELRQAHTDAVAEQKTLAGKIEAYRTDNAVKDIPNTMEAERVALDAKVESARLALSQAIKADAGKDPLKGESQATSTRPDLDTATPDKPAAKPADGAKTKTAAPPAT